MIYFFSVLSNFPTFSINSIILPNLKLIFLTVELIEKIVTIKLIASISITMETKKPKTATTLGALFCIKFVINIKPSRFDLL